MNALQHTSYPFCYYQGILGSAPSLVLFYQNNELHIRHAEENIILNCPPKEALEIVSDLINNLPQPKFAKSKPKKSQKFQYGLMGFFGFEFGLKLLGLPVKKQKENIPDFYFILPTQFTLLDKNLAPTHEYEVNNETRIFETPDSPQPLALSSTQFTSNLTSKSYNKKLTQIRNLLIKGETYQVNFAQEWTGPCQKSASELFSELHTLNPSPHEGLLHTANFSIISNSPECLYEKNGNTIKTYPIKGTLPRSEDPSKLLNSTKDQAELEMIVDLERNDLGRIAIPRSVKVTRHRYLESYSNVHHTLSEITAKLPARTPLSTLLLALFPGGSITGCPKYRTSQIIHDLEPTARGPYCGSLGIIDTSGYSIFNILIRTITQTGRLTSFHSGGGITINSIDDKEYEETLHKAENLLKVLKS